MDNGDRPPFWSRRNFNEMGGCIWNMSWIFVFVIAIMYVNAFAYTSLMKACGYGETTIGHEEDPWADKRHNPTGR
jgi:hypothetical protein